MEYVREGRGSRPALIDRRSLPTFDIADQSVDQVDIYTSEISANNKLDLASDDPTVGLVSEGVVELRIAGQAPQRIAAGASFLIPGASDVQVVNLSSEVPAKVVTFLLR